MNPSAQAKPGGATDGLPGRYALEDQDVRLPVSGQRYRVHLPAPAERDRLFAEARATPTQPPPHWTRVWSSGVALADLVLTRREEISGRRVLELGCGLGVTATAALQAGADVVAVDQAELALEFCSYNARANAGRAPFVLRIDWRSSSEAAQLRAAVGGEVPLVLAADVLYESRDIRPLLRLLDEVLTPDGTLWLAEPGRKTAQRFLYALAAEGWQGIHQCWEGRWPDGTTTPIHIHRLQRPLAPDPLWWSLGGLSP